MPLRYPNKQDLLLFVHHTHSVENLKVTRADVEALYNPKTKPESQNPYVIGCFDALSWALKALLGSPDFPCKDTSLLTNLYRTNDALYWLREIHGRMSRPLAKASLDERWSNDIFVEPHHCGIYRTSEMPLAFCMAPPPRLIEPLLHNWLLKVALFHEKIKDRVDNPYGLTAQEAAEMVAISDDTCLFFAATQPFLSGSNRLGRIVDNLLRISWNLPWRAVPAEINQDRPYQDWVKQLTQYQDNKVPQLIKAAENTLKEMNS